MEHVGNVIVLTQFLQVGVFFEIQHPPQQKQQSKMAKQQRNAKK